MVPAVELSELLLVFRLNYLKLKKSLADGKITPEEYKSGLQTLKSSVYAEARALTWDVLKGKLGLSDEQATDLLDAKIESGVLELKAAAPK